MRSSKAARRRLRALLTDTLPYEVPVIFSNEPRYASLVATIQDERVRNIFSKMVEVGDAGTIPYSYSIRKERGQTTTLGIIHPKWQGRIAEFYESYSQSILDYCRRSEFSLRRPTAQTEVFSAAELAGGVTFKEGIPHVDPAEGEMDVSHIVSYFAYGRYNLLG